MELEFNVIPTTGEFLIYKNAATHGYIAVTNENMIEVRKLKTAYGEYENIPAENLVQVIPLSVKGNRNVVGLDIDLVENIPCNQLRVVDIALP